MQTRVVDRPAFTVAGVSVSTSRPAQAADAGRLAARFFAPGFDVSLIGRADPEATYAVHADYDPADESYRLMLAYEVDAAAGPQPPGVEVLRVPAGRYTVFTAVGPQPQASIEAWKAIDAWRARPDLVRTGPVSFEVQDARARAAVSEVEIWIPATAG